MLDQSGKREECFKEFANNIAIGLLLIDGKGKCLLANSYWQKLSGYAEGDTIGEGWMRALNTPSRNIFEKQLSFALHTQRGFELEAQIITPDGLVKWLDLRLNPYQHEENESVKFVVVCSEVTEKKGNEFSLRKYEERYENIIKRASDLVYEVSKDGRFTFANPVIHKILGYTEKEIVGMNCLKLLPPYVRGEYTKFYLKQLKELNPNTYNEVPIITKSGKKIWIGQNITLTIKAGRVIGIQGVARDITEQKLADRSRVIQDSTVRILTESDSEDSAIGRILESYSSTIDYQVASWWRYHEGHNGVTCRIFWSEKHGKYQDFEKINSVLSLQSGEGMPGYVQETRRSVWKQDLFNTKNFIREFPAKKCGLASGFWVPVLVDGKVYGVFEFLFNRQEPADPDLLQLMINVASQFGQFVKRKQAEADVESGIARKQAILDSAIDCIISINHRGEIIDFNPAAERTFGYSAKEAIGKIMGDLIFPENGRAMHFERLSEFLRMGKSEIMSRRLEIVGKRRNGEEFPLELVIEPIHSPNTMPIFTGYLRDITDRKRWEKELNRAKEDAEAASLAKSQFLAVMSHEIRTPLNAIIGLGEIAVNTDSDLERKELTSIIQQNSEFLLTLIDDILDFSKIDADQITLEKVEFSPIDLIDDTAEIFALKAISKGIELTSQTDPNIPDAVIGDPSRLRQVVMNIVSNAVKFTENGSVNIELDLVKRTDESVFLEFSIIDTGIGISDEGLAQIFEKFSQADASTSRKYGGTGLGLSIARSLVNLMGGEITVESEISKGSKFSFVLEFKIVEGSIPQGIPAELYGKRILIAEASEHGFISLTNAFCTIGEEIVYVRSKSEIFDALSGSCFDLIILDRSFCGEDPVKFHHKLRQKAGEHIKIVVLSSDRNPFAGSDEFKQIVHKPFRRKNLYSACLKELGLESAIVSEEIHTTVGKREITNARILLAEDNKANQDLALRLLSKYDFSIDIANNGKEAVSMSSKIEYDLILMDIEMPEKDGFQATKEIRAREGTRRVPIIALTAHALPEYKEKCLAAGMDDYLTKPLRRQILIDRIQQMLSRAVSTPVEVATPARIENQAYILIDEDIFDLAELYLASSKSNISELRAHLAAGEFDAVRRIGHNFKGSGAGYGFEQISEIGKSIEDLAKINDTSKLASLIDQLEKYLSEVEIRAAESVST